MHTDPTLRIGFDAAGLHLATGLLAPRLTARSHRRVEVALVATGATLLGGDTVAAELSVGRGRTLVVRDTSATVAYHGRGRPAAMRARVCVGAGALLVWDAQPLVLATGAEVERTLTVEVAAGGVFLLRDTLVLGRHDEDGGVLRCRTTATYDGRPALVETLTLDEARRDRAVLGDHRVLDSALLVGTSPAPDRVAGGATDFDLAEPGRLLRWLGHEAHASPVGAAWATLRASVAACVG